jgi:hypothetical protein
LLFQGEFMIARRRSFRNLPSRAAVYSVVLLAAAVLAGQATPAAGQAARPKFKIAKAGWACYGNVYNSQMQPVPGYSVFFVNANKAVLQQYGISYTGNDGSFTINNTAPAATQLFVEVANAAGAIVYTSSTRFQPAVGSATYQKIVLPKASGPLTGKATQGNRMKERVQARPKSSAR